MRTQRRTATGELMAALAGVLLSASAASAQYERPGPGGYPGYGAQRQAPPQGGLQQRGGTQGGPSERTAATPDITSGTGTVSSVNREAGSFVVRPQSGRPVAVTITTTGRTQWVKGDGSAATFEELTTGAEVGIRGQASGSGNLTAQKVFLFVRPADGSTAATGAVTRQDPQRRTFTIQPPGGRSGNVTWTLTPSTQLQKSDGSAASFTDLTASVEVGVLGTTDSGRSTATKVILFTTSSASVSGSGTVMRVDRGSGSLMIQPQGSRSTVTISISNSTQITRPDGSVGSLADLTMGMQVSIQGKSTANGVLAERITLSGSGAQQRNGTQNGRMGGYGQGPGMRTYGR